MSSSDPPSGGRSAAAGGAGRRPVSRRRYLVRRLGALALVVVLVYAFVRAVSAVLGDGSSTAAGDPPTSATTPDPAASPPDSGGATASDAEATAGNSEAPPGVTVQVDAADTPPATEPPETSGPPSPSNPAEVYIVGDSDAGTFGPYLQRLLDGTLIIDTELNYKVSSGLSRPDFFDWPSELRRLLPEVAPDIVVVTFGGNDGQPLTVPDGTSITGMPESDTADWTEEYERRAGEVMDLLLEDERTVIWVGIPNDDNPDVTARMMIQDQAAKAAAAERPGIVFIDTWTRFSGRDGGWAEFVIDPRDGQGKDVRASDGFHLNEVGAEILALDIAQAIRDDLRARGANI